LDGLMSDQADLIYFSCAAIVCGGGGAVLLRRFRPSWKKRKQVFVAGLPVPLLVAVPSCFVFVKGFVGTALGSPSCGVDACGMEMMFGSIGVFAAVFLFGLSSAGAAIALRFFHK
jgi:hypothetical protein